MYCLRSQYPHGEIAISLAILQAGTRNIVVPHILAMTSKVMTASYAQAQSPPASYQCHMSPPTQTAAFTSRMSPPGNSTTILLRKLPRNTSLEALRSMLIFAKGMKGADFVPNEFEEDQAFSTAVAHFETATAASEAQAMLDGKPNTAGQANMIVEVLNPSSVHASGRRNTLEPSSRGPAMSTSPLGSNSQLSRQSSRFNGTFQSMEKRSPPSVHSPPIPDVTSPGSNGHVQAMFSPQSPIGNPLERSRVSGKSVIDQDAADDDTGELLKDPIAYMQNDQATMGGGQSRRSTNSQLPLGRFASLSLNTNMTSPQGPGYTSPRHAMNGHTPISAMSPNMTNMGPNAGYQLANHHYHRHNYPPVNPADQNPPCNTLYVGNLPIDTSEDELKAMFSKQRGYKRLCFRTKQNGPMCFVEFEDVSFATKALTELYGVQLHNSVKGGIRLSFSKNPLGVRAGQPGNVNPSTPLSPSGPLSGPNGMSPMTPNGYSNNNGPPPGLSIPPGLSMNSHMSPSMMNGGFHNEGLGIGPQGIPVMRGMPMNGMSGGMSGVSPGQGYPGYMMGR